MTTPVSWLSLCCGHQLCIFLTTYHTTDLPDLSINHLSNTIEINRVNFALEPVTSPFTLVTETSAADLILCCVSLILSLKKAYYVFQHSNLPSFIDLSVSRLLNFLVSGFFI